MFEQYRMASQSSLQDIFRGIFVSFLNVFIFMWHLFWCVLFYIIVKAFKNEPVCMVIGLWIAITISSNFIRMMINIFKGSPEPNSPYIVTLIPNTITEYLIYKEYMKIKNGGRNV